MRDGHYESGGFTVCTPFLICFEFEFDAVLTTHHGAAAESMTKTCVDQVTCNTYVKSLFCKLRVQDPQHTTTFEA